MLSRNEVFGCSDVTTNVSASVYALCYMELFSQILELDMRKFIPKAHPLNFS